MALGINALRSVVDIDVGCVQLGVHGGATLTLTGGRLGAMKLKPLAGISSQVEILNNLSFGAGGSLRLLSCQEEVQLIG